MWVWAWVMCGRPWLRWQRERQRRSCICMIGWCHFGVAALSMLLYLVWWFGIT